MAPVRNARVIYKEMPSGYPVPGKTMVYDESQTIDLDTVPLNGGILVKTLVLSIDPYLRGRMRDPSIESYSVAYKPGQVMSNFGVGRVLRSENSSVKAGDHVYGELPFQEYSVLKEWMRILKNEEKLPWSVYLGVGGMPGQTAHHAWQEFAHAKKGEKVFVTAGAGPVGCMVIQIAKADGLKVIASAGSQDKIDFIKSLGADVVFNYKEQKTADVLKKEGPINIYWDNVGGETLDAALVNAARYARFLECGQISGYNEEPAPCKQIFKVFEYEIKMSGFIVWSLYHKYIESFYREIPPKIAKGEIKYREDITEGLQGAGQALLNVLTGKNKGKSVILVSKE